MEIKKIICGRCGKEIIPTFYNDPQVSEDPEAESTQELNPLVTFWYLRENNWPGIKGYHLCLDCKKKLMQFIEDGPDAEEFIDDCISD